MEPSCPWLPCSSWPLGRPVPLSAAATATGGADALCADCGLCEVGDLRMVPATWICGIVGFNGFFMGFNRF